MPRTPSLETFNPKLKAAWIKGSQTPVTIEVKDKNEAIRLRYRLYKLRAALKAAEDPVFQSAQYCVVKIAPSRGDAWVVVIEPADSEFDEALSKAGLDLEVPELPEDF